MGGIVGNYGIVEVGGTVVAELKGFSIDENLEQIEDTVQGDTTKTFLPGSKTVSGTIECQYDPTDTTGQGALAPGAAVALTLYPDGSDSGKPQIDVSATILGRTLSIARDTIIPRTFNFQAQGEPVESTVP